MRMQINWWEDAVSTFRIVRNIVGTAGLLFAGYVFIVSLKDGLRYVRISKM